MRNAALRRLQDEAPLLPAILLLGAGFALPVAMLLLDAVRGGAGGFGRLASDAALGRCLLTTAIFTIASVGLELALGVAAAVALQRLRRAAGLIRTASLLPWVIPTAVMALAWRWIFNEEYGVLADLLRRSGLLTESPGFLVRAETALSCVIAADVWKTTPFVTLVLLAGLQGIPRELREAATMDGASAWQTFRHVLWPLLRPSVAVVLLFRVVQAFGAFDLIRVLTEGGPGDSTRTAAVYIYDLAIRYREPEYAAVVSIALAFLLAAVAVGLFRWGFRR